MAATAPRGLACPAGTLTGSCIQPAAASDAWVFLSWAGAAPGVSSFSCSAGGAVVCAWSSAASGPADASSCSFLMPAGAALSCAVGSGAVAFGATSLATDLALAPYGTTTREATPPCPVANATAPNDCDCDFSSPANETDTIVVLAAQARQTDEGREGHGVVGEATSKVVIEGLWRGCLPAPTRLAVRPGPNSPSTRDSTHFTATTTASMCAHGAPTRA